MAKKIKELKYNDVVYVIGIYHISQMVKYGNSKKAYSLLGKDFDLHLYPTISDITISKVKTLNTCEGDLFGIFLDNDIINYTPLNDYTAMKKTLYGYRLCSNSKEKLLEKAKDIVMALKTINRNDAEQTDKCLNDVINKIKIYEKEN